MKESAARKLVLLLDDLCTKKVHPAGQHPFASFQATATVLPLQTVP